MFLCVSCHENKREKPFPEQKRRKNKINEATYNIEQQIIIQIPLTFSLTIHFKNINSDKETSKLGV